MVAIKFPEQEATKQDTMYLWSLLHVLTRSYKGTCFAAPWNTLWVRSCEGEEDRTK